MRVLVCDDSPSILECTRALLESHGHEVETCAGMFEASFHMGSQTDVVVCDGFDGVGPNFLQAVRSLHPNTLTILHSADSALVEAEKARGFCALVKGDSWGALLAAVGEKGGVK